MQKFTLNRKRFVSILTDAIRYTHPKSPLVANTVGLAFTGSDAAAFTLDADMCYYSDSAIGECTVFNRFLLAHKSASELISLLKSVKDEIIEVELNGEKTMTITSSNQTRSFECSISQEEVDALWEVHDKNAAGIKNVLSHDEYSTRVAINNPHSVLSKLIDWAAKEDIRYYLNGLQIQTVGDELYRVNAINGHVLLSVQSGVLLENGQKTKDYIVPRQAIENMLKHSGFKNLERIELRFDVAGDRVIITGAGGWVVLSRLLDGRFPNAEEVLFTEEALKQRKKIKFDPRALSAALSLIKQKVSKHGHLGVTITPVETATGHGIKLTSRNDASVAEASMPLSKDSDGLELSVVEEYGIDYDYLPLIPKAFADNEEVVMSHEKHTAFSFTGKIAGYQAVGLIMPMRVKVNTTPHP